VVDRSETTLSAYLPPQFPEVQLSSGAHPSPSHGLCFLEMAAWFAGESHSDTPSCVCPVLGCFAMHLNDEMEEDVRNRLLKPMVPAVVDTRDEAAEAIRAEFLITWMLRSVGALGLRLGGAEDQASIFETLGTIEGALDAAIEAHAYGLKRQDEAVLTNDIRCAALLVSIASRSRLAATFYNDNVYTALGHAAVLPAYVIGAGGNAPDAWSLAVDGLGQAILMGKHTPLTAGRGIAAKVHG
jgi:hypothetical protein